MLHRPFDPRPSVAPGPQTRLGSFLLGQRTWPLLGLLLSTACSTSQPWSQSEPEAARASEPLEVRSNDGWIELFNGRDLTGWTPKIRGLPLGEDPLGTFVVRAGLLCVDYAGYERFDERFGHLFHEGEFARYRILAEYRFVGEQVPGGPGWAWRNNGLMLHCQHPASMAVDQDFPVSLEVQLLGGDGQNPRHNGNLCTPGTHVTIKGQLVTQHCIDSSSKTCPGDGWVTVEAEVRGGERLEHFVDGVQVLEYSSPVLDPGDPNAQRLLQAGAPGLIERGHIAIQGESAPIEFRRIALKPLP